MSSNFSVPSYSELVKQRNEHREEYRREIERNVEPLVQAAHDSDKMSVEIAQSVLRTATLLNGGALVAMPAIITLFGVDAKYTMRSLLIAGGLFVSGLGFSWLSSICGFFALAKRGDRNYAQADSTRLDLYRFYYPTDDEKRKTEQESELESLRAQNKQCHRAFIIYRAMAVLFSSLSFVGFVGGSGVGGWMVVQSPIRPASSSPALLSPPPCKDGTQTCQPWERDWTSMKLRPGTVVTPDGILMPPPSASPSTGLPQANGTKPPTECAAANNATECAEILKKLGKNPFEAFGFVGREPVYNGQK
jgi:hypothetical protein